VTVQHSTGTELFRNLNPEKREKVFQAAVEEFASKGYRNASMNSVVREAQISKGSLFQYFRSKRDLFRGVVEMAVAKVKEFLRQVRNETGQLPFFDRLERLLGVGFTFIDTHPLLARIYFHLLQSGEAPFGSDQIRELHMLSHKFLADLIREAVRRGELRKDLDVEQVAFLINALMETMLRSYYTEFMACGLGLYRGEPPDLDRWMKTFVGLLKEGISESPRPNR
jgi:AcrR family transcriptional regulator